MVTCTQKVKGNQLLSGGLHLSCKLDKHWTLLEKSGWNTVPLNDFFFPVTVILNNDTHCLAIYSATGASISLMTHTLMQHGNHPQAPAQPSPNWSGLLHFSLCLQDWSQTSSMFLKHAFLHTITNSCTPLPELRILWENEKVRASVLLKSQEYTGISPRI